MQVVGSREYKLMLRASKFKGGEAQLREAVGALWQELTAILVSHALAVSGTSDVETSRRQVRFLDTEDRWLRVHDYVVRERIDVDKGERKVTLKFRHPDRYISQARDMDPSKDGAAIRGLRRSLIRAQPSPRNRTSVGSPRCDG